MSTITIVLSTFVVGVLLGIGITEVINKSTGNDFKYGFELTLQDVASWLDDHNFIMMAKGDLDPTAKTLEGSEWAPILVPCEGHDCSLHVTNIGYPCTQGIEIDGKIYCRYLVNLCDPTLPFKRVPEADPKMLTDEEIHMMSDLIARIKEASNEAV